MKLVEVDDLDAEARKRTILELAFAWLLSFEPVSSVIAGATKPGQVRDNAGAASWRLSAAELGELGRLLAQAP